MASSAAAPSSACHRLRHVSSLPRRCPPRSPDRGFGRPSAWPSTAPPSSSSDRSSRRGRLLRRAFSSRQTPCRSPPATDTRRRLERAANPASRRWRRWALQLSRGNAWRASEPRHPRKARRGKRERSACRHASIKAMNLREVLTGAVVMAPMTKGSNLPYRRLCVELGARVTISEMTVARRLKQKRKGEFALIRKFEGEPFFGVQLAGTNPEEIGWAAALVESRGADLVDLNCGCPIDHFTRKGIGASLGRQPPRIRRIVESIKSSVTHIPVTVKLRLGWNDEMRNVIDQARAAVDGGADALFVHGRTRNARYRFAADWEAIGSVVAAVPVPVVGNGDILFPQDIADARARSGCAGVMSARGVLIKPWLFREVVDGYRHLSADERVAIYRRYIVLAKEHWGADAHGLERVRQFVRWHIDFWHRYLPRRADGTFPNIQIRERELRHASELDAFLARTDDAAHDYLADCLTFEREIEPESTPAKAERPEPEFVEAEG